MYTAYFDESGSPDEGQALVVAGYVASDEQWQEFDCEWRELLSSEGITRFHMRDFAHSRREFEGWKGDETSGVGQKRPYEVTSKPANEK